MPLSVSVWFNYVSAAVWAIAGVLSYPLGWAYSVAFVTAASIYANVKTDVGAALAADNGPILRELRLLRKEVRDHACHCSESVHRG